MINKYKYIFLYLGYIVLLLLIIFGVSGLKDNNILLQQDILLKQAQTHFQEQVNTRAWSAKYGGVYVFPKDGLKPNPYLPNNTLKTDSGETLIKINPAWMTRQLSELLKSGDFHFGIKSLTPINPNNKADAFEQKALEFFETNENKEYFEIKHGEDFRYMGALITTPSCLPCHQHQGYKLGDIRGGISVSINTNDYQELVEYIKNRALGIQILFIILLTSVLLLIRKQIENNENLENEVLIQTKEIQTSKTLLQEVLDTDHSLLMVADEEKIILANKTMLDFFNVNSLEEFRKKHRHISDAFVPNDSLEFLSTYMDGEHWIPYLNREQHTKSVKVLMEQNDEQRTFKVHSKELGMKDEIFNIIVFDDITQENKIINSLEEKASKDVLTNLFNRGKFNDVLEKEMDLSQETFSPLSMIFLDIDNFKMVNDTYGHNTGDYILKELSKVLLNTVRQGDFVGRWGGEEFIVTLQSTGIEEASLVAHKIRENIENYNFIEGGSQTVSLGVVQYKNKESKETFLKRVDDALYEAKDTGRNRVVLK